MPSDPEQSVIHRSLDTDADRPGVEVASAVADIEGRDVSDLSTIYDCVDDVLNHLFSTPPAPEARMQVQFSYESYRITIVQNGEAKFVKTG